MVQPKAVSDGIKNLLYQTRSNVVSQPKSKMSDGKMSEKEIAECKEAFDLFDMDGGGEHMLDPSCLLICTVVVTGEIERSRPIPSLVRVANVLSEYQRLSSCVV